MNSKKLGPLIISILIPIALGMFASLLTKNTVTIYSQLIKPPLNPPAFIFPIVWTILYILMGISSYLIYSSNSPLKTRALNIYGAQLIFNFFWSIIFFGFNMYLLAFIWLVVLILLIIWMIVIFYRISPIAAYLQIPYLLWCLFAAYLNFMVYYLNR
ncbi:MAG: tspO [Herbinix sp.]|jgi:tryptophan-rich sensory protein|nr:tspO [Herbinix sp.]